MAELAISVQDFDASAQLSFKQELATAAGNGVSSDDITLIISGGSISVTAIIQTSTLEAAQAASVGVSTAVAASGASGTFMGVAVTSTPSQPVAAVAIIPGPSPPPTLPPSVPPSSPLNAGALAISSTTDLVVFPSLAAVVALSAGAFGLKYANKRRKAKNLPPINIFVTIRSSVSGVRGSFTEHKMLAAEQQQQPKGQVKVESVQVKLVQGV